MDIRLKKLTEEIKSGFIHILGDNLTGIYIHGSVAFGCFRWDSSDVDFIVVTKTEPDFDSKRQVIDLMLQLDKSAPPKGMEMSMVTKDCCKNFVYPVPYYLHFSNSHKEAYIENADRHLKKLNGTDKDLAAHFTVINHVGITLYGPDKRDIFCDVPKEYYLDSITNDIENAAREITENPVYFTLNLCRVLAFVKQGKVLSKAEGGTWGAEHLPQFRDTILKAADCYSLSLVHEFDHDKLSEMAEFILKEIYK